MKIRFETHTNIEEVLKHNTGIKPEYGKKGSTARGDAWCTCGRCVGSLLLFKDNTVVGFLFTECTCGKLIDWSTAKENL